MNLENFKSRVVDRRHELSSRLRTIETELATPHPDDDDRAVERENEEVLEVLGEQGLAELRAIEAALRRIHEGHYGTCVQCGGAIRPERLEVLPHAPLCSDCVSERSGGGR